MTAESFLDLARSGASLAEQRAGLPERLRQVAHDAIVLREEGDGRSRVPRGSAAVCHSARC